MPITGAASDYLEDVIMKWLGRNTSMPSPPTTVYLALFTGGVPEDDGSAAIECSAGNYSRLAITTGASGTGVGSVFSTPSDGVLTNSFTVNFPMCAGANWGDVTGWATFDAPTAGNMLVRGDVTPTASITVGFIFQFTAGNWIMRLA